MKISGIVAEYNPFHNGHRYHLNETKKNSDLVVVAMSQEVVQRGQFSPFDKYWRAETALKNGADLVIGLPPFVSSQSAEYFARGSLELLNAVGINELSFGAENASPSLKKVAEILNYESPEFKYSIKSELKNGISYPLARQRTLEKLYPGKDFSFLNRPNNILALEYQKAILKNDYPIQVNPISRVGAGYHDLDNDKIFMSASGIRSSLEEEKLKDLEYHIPYPVTDLMKHYLKPDQDLFYKILMEKLLSSSETELLSIQGINRDLYQKLIKLPFNSTDLQSAFLFMKSKDLTYTNISRLFMNIILNLKKDLLELYYSNDYNPYIRILGFNNKGQKLIKNIDNPIIGNLNKDKKKLNELQQSFLEEELRISNLRQLYSDSNDFNQDYYNRPIILEKIEEING